MRRLRATVIRVLATSFLLFTSPSAALAIDVPYSIQTSAPSGRAVCGFVGAVLDAVAGDELQVTLTPASGQEAELTITFFNGLSGTTAAGVEESCDIFDPDDASNSVTLLAPTSVFIGGFSGVLDIHAHPSGDCGASDQGQGTVSAVVNGPGPGELFFKLEGCDGDEANANLRMQVDSPPVGTRGQVLEKYINIRNHGPGNATGVMFSAKIPGKAFLHSFETTQGSCGVQDHELVCDLGDIPLDGMAGVELNLIPLKEGTLTTKYEVVAENGGNVFDGKTKVKTPIMAGSGAILAVTVGCKGAGGTIVIDPNGGGTGTKTCTCPEDSKDDFLCAVETYDAATPVTLTATATTGQFDKWSKDCKGQPATCLLTVDPAAQNPDKNARAKFKP